VHLKNQKHQHNEENIIEHEHWLQRPVYKHIEGWDNQNSSTHQNTIPAKKSWRKKGRGMFPSHKIMLHKHWMLVNRISGYLSAILFYVLAFKSFKENKIPGINEITICFQLTVIQYKHSVTTCFQFFF
jgi:hypothetical protein